MTPLSLLLLTRAAFVNEKPLNVSHCYCDQLSPDYSRFTYELIINMRYPLFHINAIKYQAQVLCREDPQDPIPTSHGWY